jgi:hypothetical protein
LLWFVLSENCTAIVQTMPGLSEKCQTGIEQLKAKYKTTTN